MTIIKDDNGLVLGVYAAGGTAVETADVLPAPEQRDGYTSVLMHGDQGFYYDYEESPATPEYIKGYQEGQDALTLELIDGGVL